MVFSSIEFLLFFLPIFLVVYALTPRKIKNVTLLSGSLIFYGMGEPKALCLLMFSVLCNYFFGLHLGQGANPPKKKSQHGTKLYKRRKKIFAAAIAFNVGILIFFKSGIGGTSLPLGISFYTFQILSYLVDVYQGEVKKERDFLRLATYITMFPQLLSGPIVRYGEVNQYLRIREFTAKGLQEGLKCFTVGLAAKVLLADRIGLLWQEVQTIGFESVSTPLAWMTAVAYSMKIYFDFGGYSLMALGVGRMLGFELPENFHDPYMAISVRDFYRRWHMTLGRWFRQYVYIPLGGNRRGELRTACNLLAVWILTAVWHGTTANFLIWGMLLWLAIVTERWLDALGVGKYLHKGPGKVISHLWIWFLIPVTWMCFAITDIGQLQAFLGRMFGVIPGLRVSAADWIKALENYGILFAVGAFACTAWPRKLYQKWKDTLPGMLVLAVLFWICVWRLQREGQNPFMYQNF